MPVRRNNADDLDDSLRRLKEKVDRNAEVITSRALPNGYAFTVISGQLYIKNTTTGALSSPIV